MERVYLGDSGQCCVCGRVPSLGFLYECRQDNDFNLRMPRYAADQDMFNKTIRTSDLRGELEGLGMSKSIIATAEQGEYTDKQLEKLKALKLELKQVISDSVQGTTVSSMLANFATYAKAAPNTDGASLSLPTTDSSPSRCSFRACHTCRPYFKERIYISFGAVFSNDFRPLTFTEAATLPTKSANVARQFNLSQGSSSLATPDDTSPSTLLTSDYTLGTSPQPASRSSVLTFKTTQTDLDDLDATRQHRRRFYKMGHRSSGDLARELSRLPIYTRQVLRTAFQGVFRPSRESSSSGSNITLPMPRTGAARQLGDGPLTIGEFDMGALRRVRRQKERNDLRFSMQADGLEEVNVTSTSQQGACVGQSSANEDIDSSSESDFTVYSCISEGSEVEVSGGVALTEEAVGTHTPNILSDPLESKLNEQGQNEVDLRSIMTQV